MWSGIEGHDEVVEQFRQSLAAGRLATTYLFVGPEGVGKHAFALRLAQALLCPHQEEAALAPCGRCDSCRLALAGNHPDILTVEPEDGKSLKIKQFVGEGDKRGREGLCHDIALRPMLGRRRVAIIDGADWFTTESANCLLKLLEEPPPGAVIILIGTSRSRQLPTILSRSQVVRFNPLPSEVVESLAVREGIVADDMAARELAARSGGSLSRARELADAELWALRDRFGATWNGAQFDVQGVAREFEDFVNSAGKAAEARRGRLRQLIAVVGELFRQSLRSAADRAESIDAILAGLQRCLEAEEQLDRNANQATLIECWLSDLAGIHQTWTAGPLAASRR